MRPSRSFRRLLRMALTRLSRLRFCANQALTASDTERDRRLAFVAIEALNLWANFCRSYVLSCPFRPARLANGRVSLSNAAVSTPAAVLLLATQARRGPTAKAPTSRKDEPAWHEKDLLLKT